QAAEMPAVGDTGANPVSGPQSKDHGPSLRQARRGAGGQSYRKGSFWKHRKFMLAVCSQRERLDPGDRLAGHRRIEMREELPAARRFIFEGGAQGSLVDRNQD